MYEHNSTQCANERLKKAIENSPYSISELSKITNIPRRTLYDAFKPGHDFRISLIEEISQHIALDVNYIVQGHKIERDNAHPAANELTVKFQDQELDPSIIEEYAFIPHYNVKAEAGSGRLIEDVEPRPFPFRRHWIKNIMRKNPSDLILIRVAGDSMYPTLEDSDTVMIDTSVNKPATDAIYLIRIDDMYRIKRVQVRSKNEILLISDNAQYPDITSKTTDDEIEIIGKLIWRAGELK